MPSTTEAKRALRAQVRAQAAQLTPRDRAESDAALRARFLALPQVEDARTILAFYGVGAEPDTLPLLRALWGMGKEVLLPRCRPGWTLEARLVRSEEELVPGTYGIPEPGADCPGVEPGRIDLILVPNLCCDRSCRRLGQGGGYYDRYLARYAGPTVALCRDVLLRESVPTGAFDRPVDLVLTETESLSHLCPGGGRDLSAPPAPGGYRG